MKLEIVYDDPTLFNEIVENYPELQVIGHNQRSIKGRKEAFAFKGHWAARLDPFAILFDNEDKVIHAFYSEANECTFENINNYLISYE